MRFLVIGAGRRGWKWCNKIRQIDPKGIDLDVVGIVSRNPWMDHIKLEGERNAVQWLTPSNAKSLEFDCAIVTTPILSLFNVAREVIAQKKHVLVEKPGATSHQELQLLFDEADQASVKLVVGYPALFDQRTDKFLEYVKSGDVKSFNTLWRKWGTFNDQMIDNLICHDLCKVVTTIDSSTHSSLSIQDLRVEEGSECVNVFKFQVSISNAVSLINASFDIDRCSPGASYKRTVVELKNDTSVHFVDMKGSTELFVIREGPVMGTRLMSRETNDHTPDIMERTLRYFVTAIRDGQAIEERERIRMVTLTTRRLLDEIKEKLNEQRMR